MESIRWAFNFNLWKPTRTEWLLANRCIQSEEQNRINKFVYAKDAKAAMGGRLMLRNLICQCLKIPYADIRLKRSDKGKPYLANELPIHCPPTFSFNISHQGSYVVLAAEHFYQVGVDVMKVEYVGGKSVSDFFNTMRRQFTNDEWRFIKSHPDEGNQLARFYRFWCLKESYVKATGLGIGFSLQRLSFQTRTENVQSETVVDDTCLMVDGDKMDDWRFEETMLDDEHCVAVALGRLKPGNNYESWSSKQKYEELKFKDIMFAASPWQTEDETLWTNFSGKEDKPK